VKQVPCRRNDAIGEASRVPERRSLYGARRAAGATAREMIAAAGMGKKWLRRLSGSAPDVIGHRCPNRSMNRSNSRD
jgi:hypothetical protein